MAFTKTTTPIVYYGGKTSIQNHLLAMVPVHEVYTETFLGGGTLFWAKTPAKNETINDKLDLVINFYRCLKLKYAQLKPLIEATLIGRTIHREALDYIKLHTENEIVRNTLRHMIDPKLAWAFWVCTNFAYSNKIGAGHKYSNSMSVAVPDTLASRKRDFTEALVARIEHAYIENEDYYKILESRNVPAAFHYIDPPYAGADQGHYAGWTVADDEKLFDWCANKCKGKFLLSNYNSELLDHFCTVHGWHKQEITLKLSGSKSMNARAGKNKHHRTEVLISNYKTPCGTGDLFTKNYQLTTIN